MVMVFGGELIENYRNIRGITRKQLCEGICSESTLMRIENGTQNPGVFIFMRLIEKLGFESKKFFVGIFNESEFDFFNTYYEIESLIMSNKLDEADSKLSFLRHAERNLSKKDGPKIREQMLMVLQFSIAQNRGADSKLQNKAITDALKLTIPKFEKSKISTYMLSFDEIALLNMLAASHGIAGETEDEIYILRSVKESMDKYYLDKYEKSRGYTLTMLNLSTALGFMERHDEVIEICDIAINYCVTHRRFNLLPQIKFNKACALFYSGDKSSYKRLTIDALHTLRNNEDFKAFEVRRVFAEKEMKIKFSFEL